MPGDDSVGGFGVLDAYSNFQLSDLQCLEAIHTVSNGSASVVQDGALYEAMCCAGHWRGGSIRELCCYAA